MLMTLKRHIESVCIFSVELHIKKPLRHGNKGKKCVAKFELWNQIWTLHSMRGNLICNVGAEYSVLFLTNIVAQIAGYKILKNQWYLN